MRNARLVSEEKPTEWSRTVRDQKTPEESWFCPKVKTRQEIKQGDKFVMSIVFLSRETGFSSTWSDSRDKRQVGGRVLLGSMSLIVSLFEARSVFDRTHEF